MAGLSAKEQDLQMMLAAQCHLGTKNLDYRMERYTFKRRLDGIHLINLGKTWDKLMMAARVIVAIENPQDVLVVSARPYGQRAVLKFAQYTGAKALAGRFTPGTFTNQIQKYYEEPRVLLATDPRTDHQPVKEASLAGIPTLAFADTDAHMQYVDIAIPCNNRSQHAIAVMYYVLARAVLRMRGSLEPDAAWDVVVDLFIYREPEELEEGEEGAEVGGGADIFYNTPAVDAGYDGFGGGGFGPAPTAAEGFAALPAAGADAGGWEAAAAPPPDAGAGVDAGAGADAGADTGGWGTAAAATNEQAADTFGTGWGA